MQQRRNNISLRELNSIGSSRAVRLSNCDYADNIDIHVTLCADHGTPFDDSTIARMVCENFEFYCRRLQYTLYGYCLMPNHLHVLLSPSFSGHPLSRWLNSFKSFTTHDFMLLGGKSPLWQRSGYDHVCRATETAEAVLTYIANNPVRKGLVDRWNAWEWTEVYIEI